MEKRYINYIKNGILKFTAAALLLICTLLLTRAASGQQDFISNIFKPISRGIIYVVGSVSGLVPFSLAEIIIYVLIIGILTFITVAIVRVVRKKDPPQRLVSRFGSLVLLAASMLLIFNVFWGFNYYSMPLADELGIEVGMYSANTLQIVTEQMLEEVNRLSGTVPRDSEGCSDFGTFEAVSAKAAAGWNKVSQKYGCFAGVRVKTAKYVLASKGLSYGGLGGIFIPFTGEANVNSDMPGSGLPFTIAHELAHSAGVAPENEANFAAFLACRESPYSEYKYSGYLSAFIYCYNALVSADMDAAFALWYRLDENVQADIAQRNEYWRQFEGKVSEKVNEVNDSYLKVMSQEDGVRSYGMVVDLIIADYISTHGDPDGV